MLKLQLRKLWLLFCRCKYTEILSPFPKQIQNILFYRNTLFREGKHKLTPLSGLAFGLDRPPMALDEFLGYNKPQSRSGFPGRSFCRLVCFNPEEGVADILTHSDATVRNGNLNLVRLGDQINVDLSIGIGKFYRIRNQVPQNGLKHILVGIHHAGCSAGLEILQWNVLQICRCFMDLNNRLNNGLNALVLRFEIGLSALRFSPG